MRIRTIKPEFWESESLGNVSREARLLFVGLFSCCDDAGRARASSRLLASRLFPYDTDAAKLVPRWLSELESAGCVRLYQVEKESYLEIPKWTSHQKIDRPAPSKIPPIPVAPKPIPTPREDSTQNTGTREDSRWLASIREESRELAKNSSGTGNREQGTGNGIREGDQGGLAPELRLGDQVSVDPTPEPILTDPAQSPWHLAHGVELPEPLRTAECLAVAAEWLSHKAERRSSYKPTGLRNAVAAWARDFTPTTFPAAVRRSMSNNWQGIFLDDNPRRIATAPSDHVVAGRAELAARLGAQDDAAMDGPVPL